MKFYSKFPALSIKESQMKIGLENREKRPESKKFWLWNIQFFIETIFYEFIIWIFFVCYWVFDFREFFATFDGSLRLLGEALLVFSFFAIWGCLISCNWGCLIYGDPKPTGIEDG